MTFVIRCGVRLNYGIFRLEETSLARMETCIGQVNLENPIEKLLQKT